MTKEEEQHYHKFCLQVLDYLQNPEDQEKRESLRARAAKGKLYFEGKWILAPILNIKQKENG